MTSPSLGTTPRADAKIRKPKDFYIGLMFFFIAVVALVLSLEVPFGTSRRMGPGYFPVIISIVLSGFGAMLIVRSFFGEAEQMTAFRPRVPIFIIGGIVLFAFLIRNAGLVVAVAAMVVVASYATPTLRGWRVYVLAAVLAAGSVLVFVTLLGQPLPVFGSWFGR